MAAIPYMPFYPADYLADAAHLSTEEHGAYILLILNYWQRGKPLPSNDAKLALITKMSAKRWATARRTLSEFFTDDGECWHHKRIEAELEKFRDKSEKAKAAGNASVAARSSKQSNECSTSAQHSFNVRSTNVQPYREDTNTDADTEADDAYASRTNVHHTEYVHEHEHIRAVPSMPMPKEPTAETRTGFSDAGDNDTPGDGIVAAAKARRKAKPRVEQPEDEWIAGLYASSAYPGLNIEQSIARCRNYFAQKSIVPTRARIIAWLNRTDLPSPGITGTGSKLPNGFPGTSGSPRYPSFPAYREAEPLRRAWREVKA